MKQRFGIKRLNYKDNMKQSFDYFPLNTHDASMTLIHKHKFFYFQPWLH